MPRSRPSSRSARAPGRTVPADPDELLARVLERASPRPAGPRRRAADDREGPEEFTEPDGEIDDDPFGDPGPDDEDDEGDDDLSAGDRRGRARVFSLPAGLREATVRPGVWAVVGMLVVVLLAAGVFWVRTTRAQEAARPVPVEEAVARPDAGGTSAPGPGAAGASVPPGRSASPGAAAATGAGGQPGAAPAGGATTGAAAGGSTGVPTAGPTGATVVVQVAGEVTRPGVVHLAAGSRVIEAVERSGGVTAKAELTSVNLARVLVDGEQIVVATKGAPPAPAASGAAPTAGPPPASAPGGVSPPGTAGGPGPAGAPVNLNTADQAALEELPGVGPVLAQRILEWRTQHGRFTSVEELGEVSGVGEKTLQKLTPLVTV